MPIPNQPRADDPIMDRFHERLRELMDMHGVAAKRLSINAGLGETAVRDILMPDRQAVKLTTMVKLADYLGVTLDELVGRDDQNEADMLRTIRHMPQAQRVQIRAMIHAFNESAPQFDHSGAD
jgi:transcriptional regulator with XRE-family HTH domain